MFHALLEWKVYCVYKILNLYSSFVGSRPEAKKKKKVEGKRSLNNAEVEQILGEGTVTAGEEFVRCSPLYVAVLHVVTFRTVSLGNLFPGLLNTVGTS